MQRNVHKIWNSIASKYYQLIRTYTLSVGKHFIASNHSIIQAYSSSCKLRAFLYCASCAWQAITYLVLGISTLPTASYLRWTIHLYSCTQTIAITTTSNRSRACVQVIDNHLAVMIADCCWKGLFIPTDDFCRLHNTDHMPTWGGINWSYVTVFWCSSVLLVTSINVKPNTSSSICVCSILNVMYYYQWYNT